MRALLLLGLVAACSKPNPYYCEGNPDNNCLIDADVNAPQSCQTAADCTNSAKPICEPGQNVCVACADGMLGACGGLTPVCSSNTCSACTAHGQCDSEACLPDGSCAAATQVAYVSSTGSGDLCSKEHPCALLKDAIAKNLPYVKVAANGAANDSSTVVIDGKAVTILADPGAKLDRNGDGVVLEVRSAGADVRIYNLEITGASAVSGAHGIRVDPNGGLPKLTLSQVKIAANQGVGLYSLGGSIAVSQSTFASNAGGGVYIADGTFRLSGNVFFSNGGDASTVGGAYIQTTQNAANRLDFNSFSKNKTQDGLGTAIHCVAGVFTARNNIMSGNGTLTNMEQVGGTCTHAYSIARPGTVPVGAGNTAADPLFVNTTTGDLHIQATSPAIGAADPSSDFSDVAARDLDDQPRQSPADIGADEVP